MSSTMDRGPGELPKPADEIPSPPLLAAGETMVDRQATIDGKTLVEHGNTLADLASPVDAASSQVDVSLSDVISPAVGGVASATGGIPTLSPSLMEDVSTEAVLSMSQLPPGGITVMPGEAVKKMTRVYSYGPTPEQLQIIQQAHEATGFLRELRDEAANAHSRNLQEDNDNPKDQELPDISQQVERIIQEVIKENMPSPPPPPGDIVQQVQQLARLRSRVSHPPRQTLQITSHDAIQSAQDIIQQALQKLQVLQKIPISSSHSLPSVSIQSQPRLQPQPMALLRRPTAKARAQTTAEAAHDTVTRRSFLSVEHYSIAREQNSINEESSLIDQLESIDPSDPTIATRRSKVKARWVILGKRGNALGDQRRLLKQLEAKGTNREKKMGARASILGPSDAHLVTQSGSVQGSMGPAAANPAAIFGRPEALFPPYLEPSAAVYDSPNGVPEVRTPSYSQQRLYSDSFLMGSSGQQPPVAQVYSPPGLSPPGSHASYRPNTHAPTYLGQRSLPDTPEARNHANTTNMDLDAQMRARVDAIERAERRTNPMVSATAEDRVPPMVRLQPDKWVKQYSHVEAYKNALQEQKARMDEKAKADKKEKEDKAAAEPTWSGKLENIPHPMVKLEKTERIFIKSEFPSYEESPTTTGRDGQMKMDLFR
ncbi:uncharacterized protein L3040_004827 [Drepanopeziza brunnea f. sp. 'multigermtubi']|uniref:uncharacterized protein n=1 Tax=Drepanopeziza brunnea f. sp. 'multigermtubi' TaxID=698441 RepID=UPI002387AD96|nr:hypothetical protein L3040_004827 [Drepanopeziza brunnea f. sp. 'multigermtubi']